MSSALRGLGRLALLELRLYAALVRWVLRRRDVPPGAEPWPYAALAAPLLWLWVFGSATEVVVLHLVIPWPGVRLAADVVSIWGLAWMLGTLAAYRIRPHLLLPGELRVRNSVYHDVAVPRVAIGSARVREVDLPSSMRSLQVEGGDLSLGVSGRTNVQLELREATALRTAKGTLVVRSVAFWVDDPKALVARLGEPAEHRR